MLVSTWHEEGELEHSSAFLPWMVSELVLPQISITQPRLDFQTCWCTGSIPWDKAGAFPCWQLQRAHEVLGLPPAVGFSLNPGGQEDEAASRTLLQTHQTSKVTVLESSCRILLALVWSDLASFQNGTSKLERDKPVRSLSLRCHHFF